MRLWHYLHGPFPVQCRGQLAGVDKRQFFDAERANARKFEVHYGFNPRCQFRGTWMKPGTGHWRHT